MGPQVEELWQRKCSLVTPALERLRQAGHHELKISLGCSVSKNRKNKNHQPITKQTEELSDTQNFLYICYPALRHMFSFVYLLTQMKNIQEYLCSNLIISRILKKRKHTFKTYLLSRSSYWEHIVLSRFLCQHVRCYKVFLHHSLQSAGRRKLFSHSQSEVCL